MLVRNNWHQSASWVKSLEVSDRLPAYSTALGGLFHTNALDVLAKLPAGSVDLVMTSPPFALTRQKEYGNEPVERYLEWFLPFTREIKRVLKDTGSFVLDIGGAWLPGAPVRSTYHFEVAIKLVQDGFRLAQDFYWYNPSRLPSPAEWVTVRRVRVKDAVNMVWWFSKTDHPHADTRRAANWVIDTTGESMERGPSGNVPAGEGGAIPANMLTIPNAATDLRYMRACEELGVKPPPFASPTSWCAFLSSF